MPDIEKATRLAELYEVTIDSLMKTDSAEGVGMLPPAPLGKDLWDTTVINDRGQLVIPHAGMANTPIDALSGKDAKTAYALLLQLEQRSENGAGLYPLLDDFLKMLHSENSLARARGFRLAVAQARWDSDNKIDARIDELLVALHDTKGTVARQCLQFASVLLDAKPYLLPLVARSLESMDLTNYPDGIRPLIAEDAAKLAAHAHAVATHHADGAQR